MRNDPAAPKVDAVSLRPKYSPIRNFPIVTNIAVMNAPTHTSRHRIFASGTNLYINPKSRVIIPSETTRSPTRMKIANKLPSSRREICPCRTASIALITSERRSNIPITRIIPNDTVRFQINPRTAFRGSATTFHIAFSAS